MNAKTLFTVLIFILEAVTASATDYPYYYCYQEAPSYSLPFNGEIYTQGDYKVGDFY